MSRVRLEIFGRVQGVGFRAAASLEGRRLGLAVEPHNRHDGSVEIIATGELAALDAFTAWCHRGPALARVERVVRTGGTSPS